jgi:hypothetical protein
LHWNILPDEIEDVVIAWLAKHGAEPPASFVYSSWLLAGGDPSTIRVHALKWLDRFEFHNDACFVFAALIERDRGVDLAARAEAWLGSYGEIESAHPIYSALLARYGISEDSRPRMISWLKQYSTHSGAIRLIQEVIDSVGFEDIVEPILKGLDSWGSLLDASFILQRWLEHGRDPSAIRLFMTRWLDRHWQIEDRANYVIAEWAKTGADLLVIEPAIKKYLAWSNNLETHYRFLSSWFLAGGALRDIEPFMKACLKVCATQDQVRFVYEGWLDRGGETDAIRPYVRLWLDERGDQEYARHLYANWPDIGKNWEFLREYVWKWLSVRPRYHRTDVVLYWLLKHGAPFSELRQPTLDWLRSHSDTSYASRLLSYAVNEGTVVGLDEIILAWPATGSGAGFMYEALLDQGYPVDKLQSRVHIWLDQLNEISGGAFVIAKAIRAGGAFEMFAPHALKLLAEVPNRGRTGLVLSAWMDAGWPLESIEDSLKTWLVNHTARPEAASTYLAWMARGGANDIIGESASMWVQTNRDDPRAEAVSRKGIVPDQND